MLRMNWSRLAIAGLSAASIASGALFGQGEIPKEARDAFTRAVAHHKAKRVDDAIQEFLKAYAADARVLTFDDAGLLDGAVAALGGRLAAAPQDLDVNFKLAELNNIKGYTDESSRYYKKVVSLAPQSAQAGIAREELRKLEAAAAAAKAASATAQTTGARGPAEPAEPEPAKPTPDEAAQARIQQLQEELEQAKKENEESKEKLEKLQKEYDELNKKAQNWYFYYTRFFADPANVDKLRSGQ